MIHTQVSTTHGKAIFADLRCMCRNVGCIALVGITFLVGCGGDGAATTSLEGKITFNGQPVTFGLINFKPAKGQPLGGEIQPEGTYRYDLPPGEYQVRIDSPAPIAAGYKEGDATPTAPASKPGKGQVPANFANFDTSGLTVTVGAESPQQHDFKLP